MNFVCAECRAKRHDLCRGDSWCDCQHRTPADRIANVLTREYLWPVLKDRGFVDAEQYSYTFHVD